MKLNIKCNLILIITILCTSSCGLLKNSFRGTEVYCPHLNYKVLLLEHSVEDVIDSINYALDNKNYPYGEDSFSVIPLYRKNDMFYSDKVNIHDFKKCKFSEYIVYP